MVHKFQAKILIYLALTRTALAQVFIYLSIYHLIRYKPQQEN